MRSMLYGVLTPIPSTTGERAQQVMSTMGSSSTRSSSPAKNVSLYTDAPTLLILPTKPKTAGTAIVTGTENVDDPGNDPGNDPGVVPVATRDKKSAAADRAPGADAVVSVRLRMPKKNGQSCRPR